jgi:hypothetical protein
VLEDVPSWYFCVGTSQQGNTARDAARESSLSTPWRTTQRAAWEALSRVND